ncbi:uncharacterized protein LOC129608421 isoform X2 [Condylostylus longicornis]|uniref:uncharacterized protein LOC129608421 isoform X2 n=1 Tax=Condylostylus longicornis TaxID=2530218 RepID=UPI00244E050B|nr:uncharacterized protein LOC129608421 isoform X2 [Condylostylus longicornis]
MKFLKILTYICCILLFKKIKINLAHDLEDLSCIGNSIETYQNNKCFEKSNNPLYTSLNTFDWRSLFPRKYSKTTLYAFDGRLRNFDNDLKLKVGDLIQCEIIEHDNDYNSGEINVTTTHSNDHTYFVSPQENCFSFRVRAKTAIIGLSGNPIRSNMIIELVLQAAGNSYIRKGSKFETVTQVNIPHIVDEGEYRGFWIKWNSIGVIEIGRDDDILPFLTYKEQNMFPINYVGIHTWEHPGNWILNFDDTRCVRLPTKDRPSLLITSVKLQKELLEQLEDDHETFEKTDRKKTKTFLDGTVRELKRNFEHSEDLHNKIFFSDAEDDDEISREKYMKEKIFEKIKNIFYNFMEDLDEEYEKLENST